ICLSAILIVFGLSGCSDMSLDPLTENGEKPAELSNITVTNEHGGATISYVLPDDPQLLYVQADFLSEGTGEKRTAKSSVFKSSITLDGFMSTDERKVQLYTVNRSEVRSEPIEVTIKPLVSPIEVAFESLKVAQDFGGVNVQFDNETGNEYVLYILTKDENRWSVY